MGRKTDRRKWGEERHEVVRFSRFTIHMCVDV